MSTEQATLKRTPAKRKARQLAKHLRAERPDYAYLKEVFRHLRDELDVEVAREPKRLPYVPTEAEVRRYYETVWKERRGGDIVLIKTLLYTGVRVAELVAIRLDDVDLDTCRIRINLGKGAKDRVVPLPTHLPRDAQPAHRLPAIQRSSLPIRVELEEALLHPGSPSPARPLRPQGRPGAQHAPPPPPPLPVHLAQDPRPRRRPHPALTAATPAANPSRSTAACPSPTPKTATTRPSGASRSDRGRRFAPGDTFRSRGPCR